MKKTLIFGTGKIAEVVAYYATEECGIEVAAFVVNAQYKTADTFLGKPVIEFEKIADTYSPENYNAFAAVGYHDMNKLRATICEQLMQMGYELISVISPKANVPVNVKTGYNCFIMSPAVIHPCVEFGNNVFVWSGAMIGHHSKIGNHVWLTSSCNIGGNVNLGNHCFVAMGATLGNSITVGNECFLGANVLVTKNLEDEKVVITESDKPIKLNTKQFLKMSGFSSL